MINPLLMRSPQKPDPHRGFFDKTVFLAVNQFFYVQNALYKKLSLARQLVLNNGERDKDFFSIFWNKQKLVLTFHLELEHSCCCTFTMKMLLINKKS